MDQNPEETMLIPAYDHVDVIIQIVSQCLASVSIQMATLLNSNDYCSKFHEVTLKALFLGTLFSRLESRCLLGRCKIESEASPDGKPGSYVDLIIRDSGSNTVIIIEFKYTGLGSIKDMLRPKPTVGNSKTSKSLYITDKKYLTKDEKQKRDALTGAKLREEQESIHKQWKTTWRENLMGTVSTPGSSQSSLTRYGIYDFWTDDGQDISLYDAFFSTNKASKDDLQVLNYAKKVAQTGQTRIHPILVRGIFDQIFYCLYGYDPVVNQDLFTSRRYYYPVASAYATRI